LLDVKISQSLERTEFSRSQLGDLFIDRDRFAVETVVQVHLGQSLEMLDGVRHVSLTGEKIAHRHQRRLILGVVAEDLLVFGNRLSDLALTETFQRALELLAFVERHMFF
jgi:hypothetical protein